MGTINYGTSNYITIGIKSYDASDFEKDIDFMEELQKIRNRGVKRMKHHVYAVKYIDEKGHTISNGYAESMTYYPNGTIIEPVKGTRILIEFEMG